MTAQPLDLTSSEVTRRLLRDPRDWRERAVERLHLGSAQFVARERSLQCRPLHPVVADLVGDAPPSSHGFVVLPLGLLPKQPLHDFRVSGPVSQPVLLRRPEIAHRESALVMTYAEEAGLHVPDSLATLLPVLLAFTEGSWAAVKADAGRHGDAMKSYLDVGLSAPLGQRHLGRLRSASDATHAILDPYNEADPRSTSAAESPFLVVPVLVEGQYVSDDEQAVQAVEDYRDLLDAAAERVDVDSPNAASDLLQVLADYGRHWELMVLAEVPLDRPFSLTYEHLDPVPVLGFRNRIAPAVVIADADSNHIELSLDDPGTRLIDVVGRHPRTGAPAQMGSTSRQTNELHAFYVWEVDVDFRVLLATRLGVLRRVALANIFLSLLIGLVALALVVRAPKNTAELAVTAGPAAAAASLLLLREPSTLASRLRLRYTTAVALMIMLLLAVACWRFTTLPHIP